MKLRSSLLYLAALLRLTVTETLARPLLAATSAVMMFGNNLIFFLVWVIYFANFSNIRGWILADLALLIGVVAWAFGLTVFLTGGVRDLAQTIVDGRLDIHLGRPRHPLPGLLMSRSLSSGLGDMASAFVFWLWLGGIGLGDLPLLVAVSTAAAIVLAATLTISQCIVFWLPGALSLCEDLFNMLMMVAFYPQHPYGFAVRLVLFTVFPTAFISLLPVEAVRDHDPQQALAVLGAAVVYAGLAALVFERGLRRYSSGNRVLELR
ncbi:MAG: ABC-2 family transporter protein [Proteobacteria bacterium]|nr:ABC-2 family transporter protein [Pseudomonadota bacterium]